MSLDESVDLVMHAFSNGSQGDIFVQKSPACTLLDLVTALKNIFNYKKENIIIGTRHGEKLYESLLSREEMARVEDNGKFFRLPSDNRSLNYDKFFKEGKEINKEYKEYTSHNTRRLSNIVFTFVTSVFPFTRCATSSEITFYSWCLFANYQWCSIYW